tara:strand:- start:850 stop:1008 length:159 start_codon:yes stop_codon:yes gene_type:complete
MTEFLVILECLSLVLLALVLVPNWISDTKLELVYRTMIYPLAVLAFLIYSFM